MSRLIILISDTSNVSTGDLDNIAETDTPPPEEGDETKNSPTEGGDTVTFNLSSNNTTSAQYRKVDSNHQANDNSTDLSSVNGGKTGVAPILSAQNTQQTNMTSPRGSGVNSSTLTVKDTFAHTGRPESPEFLHMRTESRNSKQQQQLQKQRNRHSKELGSPTEVVAAMGRELQPQRIGKGLLIPMFLLKLMDKEYRV